MNISLTAISILWAISDFIADRKNRSDESIDPKKDSSAWRNALDVQGNRSLWVSLFSELKQLSCDSRAEVRNSAVQTLCKALSILGTHFSLEIWDACFENVFPS